MEVLSNFTSVLPCPIRSLLGTKACNKPSPMETRKIKPSESAVPDQPDLSSKPSFEVVESGLIWCDHSSPQHRGDKMSQSSRNSVTKNGMLTVFFGKINKLAILFLSYFDPLISPSWLWVLDLAPASIVMLHTDILASPFGNVTFVFVFLRRKKNMPPWTCSRRRLHLQLQKMMEVDPPFSFSCRRKLGLHLLHVKMTRTVHDTVSCSCFPLSRSIFAFSSLIHPWILTSYKIQLHIQCHQLYQWFRWCGGSRPVRRQVGWKKLGFLPCNVHSIIFPHVPRPWKWLPQSASQKLWSALAY